MISLKKSALFLLVFFFVFSSAVFAEGPPLKIDSDGKVNIDYVLNLKPTELPPENPSSGDIYLTTDHQLMLFTTHWIKIMTSEAALNMGIETLSIPYTTAGTWIVPPSVNNITVTLVAGGMAGSYGGGDTGGSGGSAGEIITQNITVTPGDSIGIVIGSSNQISVFGSLLTARSGYGVPGTAGSPAHSCQSVKGSTFCIAGNGGRGANGYGSVSLAGTGTGTSLNGFADGGAGGTGYGAGGGGGAGHGGGGGAGAPGYCLISYEATKYQLPDGTVYYEQ